MAGLPPVMRLDGSSVTVAGGVRYGELATYLDRAGFALPNLGSLPHISVAGACSTGTHGSGDGNGNMTTAVSAVELVTADGDLVTVRRGDPDLNGVALGLGALGIVTRLTLDVVPAFEMRQYVYENLPFSEVKEHFDAIMSSAYSVSLFTDWQKQRVNEVWLKSRVEKEKAVEARQEFFGAKLATKNLHPIAALSAENCTPQMGVPGPWYERLPHFRMGFTPSAGKELQSEYFVPRRHAVEAILAVERLHDQVGPHLLISEIRSIAADNLWMSTCHKEPRVTIHFTWKQDWAAVRKLLPIIERELAPFDVRPHWGKLFTIGPEKLRSSYEKLPDFIELCRRYDPKGKFRNDFLNRNIFATGS